MEISLGVTLAVLGAALLHASWNVLVKSGADKELETINIALGSGLVALIAAPFLPAPAPASWPWVAGSAVVHILYFVFLAGAYRWGELSYTYPVMRGGGPMIVAVVGALALGEVLPLGKTLGIVLICAGVLAFASGRHDRRATAFALGDDPRPDRGGRSAARDLGDLRRSDRFVRAAGKIHAPAACGHRRGDAGTRGAEALDRLQLALVEPHAVAL